MKVNSSISLTLIDIRNDNRSRLILEEQIPRGDEMSDLFDGEREGLVRRALKEHENGNIEF